MKSIWAFIKYPMYHEDFYKNKTKPFLVLSILNIGINLSLMFVLDFGQEEQHIDFFKSLGLVEQIVFIGILAPIIEEFMYRFPLKLKVNHLSLIFLVTIPIALFLIFPLHLISGIFISIYIIFYIIFRKQINLSIIKRKEKYFNCFFFGTSVLFALSHIHNFIYDPLITIVILIVLAFISSILFSFIRVLISFKHAVYSHIIYNCFIVVLNFLYPNLGS